MALAFSFGPLLSKSALRLLISHLVTDAASISGTELTQKCAVAQLGMAGLVSSAFPDDGVTIGG